MPRPFLRAAAALSFFGLLACGGGADTAQPPQSQPLTYYASGPSAFQAFHVDPASGGFEPASAGPVAAALSAESFPQVAAMGFSADGGTAFLATEQHLFSCRRDPATGALTPSAEAIPLSVDADSAAVDPTGRFLFLGGDTKGLAGFTLRGQGSPEPMNAAGSAFTAGDGLLQLAFSPSGRFLFLPDLGTDAGRGRIWSYALDAEGRPSGTALIADLDADTQPLQLQPSPDGRFLYAVLAGPAPSLATFSVDPASGALSRLDPAGDFKALVPAQGFYLLPSGRFALLCGRDAAGGAWKVQMLRVDAEQGRMQAVGEALPMDAKASLLAALAPDGRTLVVSTLDPYTADSTSLWSFLVDPEQGTLRRGSSFQAPARSFPLALR